MPTDATKWIVAVSFLLAAVGFFLPFWPLSLCGILLAAFSGRWIFAVCIGLVLDVAWGAPLGMLHFLYVPFTLAAVLANLVRLGAARHMRQSARETL